MSIIPILVQVLDILNRTPTSYQFRAYLFGSTARLKWAWSDIDILVVCQSHDDGLSVRNALSEICHCYPIDLNIMTEQEEKEFDFIKSENCKELNIFIQNVLAGAHYQK